MNRAITRTMLPALLLPAAVGWTACASARGETVKNAAPVAVVDVASIVAEQQPITRYLHVTGTLTAEEQADVAAETTGRVVSVSIERGRAVAAGEALIHLSTAETEAQLDEAVANAAQIEARLGLTAIDAFDAERVPEVQHAKAAFELAQSELARITSLLAEGVVSQSEFDQRQTQRNALGHQYEGARNTAAQQYQSLRAARARIALVRKSLADAVVRAPFSGVVAERTVSLGDYVTRGTKVAVLVRIDPLRAELTVPEQYLAGIATGQSVALAVDAYPSRTFEGTIRFVSPSLRADRRALTVEASVPNPSGALKPGLFVTARVRQPDPTPGVLVPREALQTTAGTSRLYVVSGDHVEERVVGLGDTVGTHIEITDGLKPGEHVATAHAAELADGMKVR